MLKLGFNEATCKENSTVERDLALCEKYGYDYIELRLDMLKAYFENHTMDDLKAFFAGSHLKPFAFNSIEDINFNTPEQWEKLVDLFTFGCKTAEAIGNPYMIVVPTMGPDMDRKTEAEVFEDSVKVLNRLADIAEPYGVKLSFEPIGDRRWCCNSMRQAWEIVQAVGRDSVGLTVDCINFYMHDKCADLEYLRKIPTEKIFVYHINDCEDLPLRVLDHCHRIMPGKGCIPVADISRVMSEIGYDGPACLELFRPEYWAMDAEEVIKMGAACCAPFLKA
ncbi:sugar phosphate isomerase/epimerase [Butyricicoccus faecihominis]|uniref:sugar phosphate isomerase/epimerase family protein n=1 Tax=Butyricicoccus faecihominis TaxID=1712515 RepID=UPI002479D8C6|nr:sugar phosphate isomerase/epimerase family protein [Butyricicoccus faecihominis]MCQ5128628.1 sugar phosphate isomerase/epimerase [Butyricicoccus faecihominis]